MESRRRHELEELHRSHDLNKQKASTLSVGTGFFGAEWGTEIDHFFRNTSLTIIQSVPRDMGPLLDSFAEYWSAYITTCGLKELVLLALLRALKDEIRQRIERPSKVDVEYICIGAKASIDGRGALGRQRDGPGGEAPFLLDGCAVCRVACGRTPELPPERSTRNWVSRTVVWLGTPT